MARKRYTAEEIIDHLRTIEIETGTGVGIVEICRKLGITEQTYYRWKKEYGGLRVDQAKRLKGLELENVRRKRLVADLSPDNSILKEVWQREPSKPGPTPRSRVPCAGHALGLRTPGVSSGGQCRAPQQSVPTHPEGEDRRRTRIIALAHEYGR
jgi:putative transposase